MGLFIAQRALRQRILRFKQGHGLGRALFFRHFPSSVAPAAKKFKIPPLIRFYYTPAGGASQAAGAAKEKHEKTPESLPRFPEGPDVFCIQRRVADSPRGCANSGQKLLRVFLVCRLFAGD
jgi:hypothetical protein